MTVDEVVETARASWPGSEGDRRADKVRSVIGRITREYGEAFDMKPEDVFEAIESTRDYSAVNFYQDAKFPSLQGVTVYETLDSFKVIASKGFRCPSCEAVSEDPYECDAEDCDWKSYGLMGCLGKGHTALVRDRFPEHPVPVTIFMPVTLESADPTTTGVTHERTNKDHAAMPAAHTPGEPANQSAVEQR